MKRARGQAGSARGRCQLQGRKNNLLLLSGEGDKVQMYSKLTPGATSTQDVKEELRGHDGWSEQQAHIFAKWIYCLYDGWSPGY